MSEFTPTIEQLEDGYAHDPEAEYRNPENYGSTVAANRRAFRRALEAHDREVAAKAIRDAVEWARSCSGESADAAADYIEEMAAALGVPEETEHG